MSNPTPKVFLSSTYVDLREHRLAAQKAIAHLGLISVGAEDIGANPEESSGMTLKMLEECDFFIGIYAHRYGIIASDRSQSFIELEFDRARELGISCLCYQLDSERSQSLQNADGEESGGKFDDFMRKVKDSVIVGMFITPDDLEKKVLADLSREMQREKEKPLSPADSSDTKAETSKSRSTEKLRDLGKEIDIDGVKLPKHHDVYIAFSQADAQFAGRLYSDLTKQNLLVWFEDREFPSETESVSRLYEGIENSRSVAVILTSESVRSSQVRSLYLHAVKVGILIIPVLLGDVEIPEELQNLISVDARDSSLYEKVVIAIIDIIHGKMPVPPDKGNPRPEPKPPVVTPLAPPSTRTEVPTRALADTTSEDNDLLHFDDYAQALADFIKNEKTGKPLTIGIDAAWGMGKSTLMRILQKKLSGLEEAEKKAQAAKQETVTSRTGTPIRSMTEDAGGSPSRPNAETPESRLVSSRLRDAKLKYKPFRGPQGFPTVWFNAWKYSKEESLWAALALEILKQIREQSNRRQKLKLASKLTLKRLDTDLMIQRALKSVAVVALLGILGTLILFIIQIWGGFTHDRALSQILLPYARTIGAIGGIAGIYSIGKQAYDKIAGIFDLNIAHYLREPKYQERIGFLAEFQDDYKRLVDVVTEEGRWPLIVFVDDLDRCPPPKLTEIIEAINLLLDAEHCVFVLGMDARTVAGGVEAKYKDLKPYLDDGDDPGGLTLGQRFLEKIVQISFRIPRSEKPVMDAFIENNVSAAGSKKERPPAERVQQVKEKIQAEQRAGKTLEDAAQAIQVREPSLQPDILAQAKQEVRALSFDDSPDVAKAIAEASEYLKFNPRKIKQFINLFRLRAFLANRRGLLDKGEINLSTLSRWVVIRVRWPDFVQATEADSKFIARLYQAIDIREKMLAETDDNRLKHLKTQFEALAKDRRIERLTDAADLVELLNQVKAENMPTYLGFV
jgi:hypothetical protein